MVIAKIVLTGAVLIVLMTTAQDQRWPQRSGMVGVCAATATPGSASDTFWYACKEGIINGFPNLEADRCVNAGVVQRREYWQCDRAVDSLPGA